MGKLTRSTTDVAQVKKLAEAMEFLGCKVTISLSGNWVDCDGREFRLHSKEVQLAEVKRKYIAGVQPCPFSKGLAIEGTIKIIGEENNGNP